MTLAAWRGDNQLTQLAALGGDWGREGSLGEATVEAAVEAAASADLWRRAALTALHEVGAWDPNPP